MKYMGEIHDKNIFPDGVIINNPYPHNKRRIYKEDVDMATINDLNTIDDRIFKQEPKI